MDALEHGPMTIAATSKRLGNFRRLNLRLKRSTMAPRYLSEYLPNRNAWYAPFKLVFTLPMIVFTHLKSGRSRGFLPPATMT